jgi:hypothetical protein
VSLRSLTRAIERRGAFRGKRRLLRILADAAPTRTELEDIVLDLILDAQFEPPDVTSLWLSAADAWSRTSAGPPVA